MAFSMLNEYIDNEVKSIKSSVEGYPLHTFSTSGFPDTIEGQNKLGQVHALTKLKYYIEEKTRLFSK